MRYIVIVLFLLASSVSYAQVVYDVDCYQQGKEIVITYNLEGTDNYNIKVSYSPDGGRNYTLLKSVRGDVDFQKAGIGKQIVWNVLSDVPQLVSSNVVFKVDAEKDLGLSDYNYALSCEIKGKYAEAMKYYKIASIKGYKQADAKIKELQLKFW